MSDDDHKSKLRPPLRPVIQEDAERAERAGEVLGEDIGDFKEWDAFRWNDDPAGYIIWAKRVRKAIHDYMHKVEPMPDPYWFLRGFMARWRRIHQGFLARFLERRAHYESEVRGNKLLAQQLMLYAKAIDLGRDLDPTGAFVDGMEDVVGLCPQCGALIYARQLVSFEPPHPDAYLQHLHSRYACEGCSLLTLAKNMLDPKGHGNHG